MHAETSMESSDASSNDASSNNTSSSSSNNNSMDNKNEDKEQSNANYDWSISGNNKTLEILAKSITQIAPVGGILSGANLANRIVNGGPLVKAGVTLTGTTIGGVMGIALKRVDSSVNPSDTAKILKEFKETKEFLEKQIKNIKPSTNNNVDNTLADLSETKKSSIFSIEDIINAINYFDEGSDELVLIKCIFVLNVAAIVVILFILYFIFLRNFVGERFLNWVFSLFPNPKLDKFKNIIRKYKTIQTKIIDYNIFLWLCVLISIILINIVVTYVLLVYTPLFK